MRDVESALLHTLRSLPSVPTRGCIPIEQSVGRDIDFFVDASCRVNAVAGDDAPMVLAHNKAAEPAARPAREVGDTSVDAGRGPGQMGWYQFAADHLVAGRSVLDAGCGLGVGLDLLAGSAAHAHGQDLDPRLARPDVTIGPLENIADKSYDVVTCIDVIEHVEADHAFVLQLGRIARQAVLVTTPNWTVSRCHWPYHIREYTPRQLRTLLSEIGSVEMIKGEPGGYERWPVNDRTYDLLNDARIWPPTAFLTRCVSRVLPAPLRLRAHLGAIVTIR
jgi:SAM-dependent methyltransferase